MPAIVSMREYSAGGDQQEQDADGDVACLHQDTPEARQIELPAQQGDDQGAEGADRPGFGGGEEAAVEPA